MSERQDPLRLLADCRVVPRASGASVRPHWSLAASSLAASLGLHLMALVALAVSLDRWHSAPRQTHFAGQSRTWSVEAHWMPPQPEVSVITARSSSEPVVVQPAEVQVADRTYRFAPSDPAAAMERPVVQLSDGDAHATSVRRPDPSAQAAITQRAMAEELTEEVARDVEMVRRTAPAASPPPTAAPLAVPSPARPQEAGAGTREAPRFFNNRPPAYPETARQRRWQGTVYLRIRLDASGKVSTVEVARSSGYPLLDAEAANAVRQWQAEPARVNGQPVATEELLPVRFELP